MLKNKTVSAYLYPQQASVSTGTNRLGRKQRIPFKLIKGTDTRFEFHIKKDNGNRQPIYDSVTITAHIHKHQQVILSKTLKIIDYNQGICELVVSKSDTLLFDDGFYAISLIIGTQEEDEILYSDSMTDHEFDVIVSDSLQFNATDVYELTDFYSNGSNVDDFYTKQVPGSSQKSYSNGIHTVSWILDEFEGEIKIQASAIPLPKSESDWFDIPIGNQVSALNVNNEIQFPIEYTQVTTATEAYTVEGSFYWIRVFFTKTQGSLDKITINL